MVHTEEKNEGDEGPDRGLESTAATLIQSSFRGHRVRQQLKRQGVAHCAALTIQSNFRGYAIRRRTARRLQEHRAATRIQSSFRGYRARATTVCGRTPLHPPRAAPGAPCGPRPATEETRGAPPGPEGEGAASVVKGPRESPLQARLKARKGPGSGLARLRVGSYGVPWPAPEPESPQRRSGLRKCQSAGELRPRTASPARATAKGSWRARIRTGSPLKALALDKGGPAPDVHALAITSSPKALTPSHAAAKRLKSWRCPCPAALSVGACPTLDRGARRRAGPLGAHRALCPCCAKSRLFWTRFDCRGDRNNYCVLGHRTAQILTQSKTQIMS